ncbi:hypothetical protein Poli38472_000299 [Pythium oligandrum]|uniref:U3 small nucleolar RNA-associated protein 14 n=1 Tax=Pythium oligandrum TaxID=41045 RepID=A0A8K1FHZ2_PYTOL|nr:hypothetical protein Poli38472_000299 [Pythium oligandrum]|eukprot:TMW60257.1 hypothetical protein Poli38472_000299 [Pythium oligandrum]
MARGGGNAKGKRRASAPKRKGGDKVVARDVYSDDDDDEKEARMNDKMDIDGVYEYEQPETFEQDSEIDEDEAFNSEDEEQYGSFFNKKGKKSKGSDNEDTADDEEDDEDVGGGDLLSDMLGTAPAARLSTAKTEEEDDDEDGVFEDSDEDDDETSSEQKQRNLASLVDQLVPTKQKKKLQEIAEEGAYDDGELTLSSLLGGGDEVSASKDGVNLSKVKKQIRDLEADAAESGPLSAAIAPVHEERASRKIAYTEKKEEMDLFQPVVRRNRQKETMDFREQIPKMENLTAAGLASKFSAETSLEKDVEALLKTSGLSDRTIAKEEHDELMQKKVSTEEVMQRQKELSKMRALMFYEEQKAKRVKKIKSKLYHKIRNNQNKKEQDKQRQQLRELDPELAKQLDAELAEKRAEERMTLKHTNTSKWVKHQLKRGIQADNETRSAIAEQLRRGDDLRRKMQSMNSDDEDDVDLSDDDEDDSVDAVTRLQRRLEKQAGALVTEIDQDEANAGKVKGLAGMKFMQRAVQKQREKARTEAEKLLREIKGEDGLLSDEDYINSDDEDNSAKQQRKTKKQKTEVTVTEQDKEAVAKALPRGALQTGAVSMDRGLSARASGAIAVDLGENANGSAVNVEKQQTGTSGATLAHGSSKKEKKTTTQETPEVDEEVEENPWLSGGATKGKKSKKKNKKNGAKGNVDVGNAIDALAKAVVKQSANDVDISKAASAAVAGLENARNEKKRKLEERAPAEDASKKNANNKKQKKMETKDPAQVSQEELVRRAFAFADEGENEIAQEKEDIAAQDATAKKGAEIAKLVGMSGWGSWAGVGVQKSYRQKVREEQAKQLAEDTKKQVLLARKDSKMERVLINEKKDKRAAKFTVNEVPYPFTSREEYEMAMRNPLGSDWNTPSATNTLTAPKLITRAGQMIDPLKLSKEDKKQAKKELSKKRKAKF